MSYMQSKEREEVKKDSPGIGSSLAASGAYVLKLNIAGSGDEGWRKFNKKTGLRLTGHIWKHNRKGKMYVDHSANAQEIKENYGENYGPDSLVWKKNEQILIKGNEENQTTVSPSDSYNKETISVAGPLALGGLIDTGDYSIKNNIERSTNLAINRVHTVLSKDPNKKVFILIKGHSRSAVATSQIAVNLAHIFKDFKNVDISFVQFDPVPGPFHFGVDSEIDYKKGFGKNTQSNALQKLNSTVIYSMKTEHNAFFSPQAASNSNRLILVKWTHEAGLNKSKGFEFGGMEFHGSSLVTLPSGVYIQTNSPSDDSAKLKKVSPSDCSNVIKTIKDNGNFLQRKRTNTIINVVRKKLGQEVEEEASSISGHDTHKKLNDESDVSKIPDAPWNEVPYLKEEDDISEETIIMNSSLSKLKKKLLRASNESDANPEKTDLRKSADRFSKEHMIAYNKNIRLKKSYYKVLKTRVDKEVTS